MCTPGAGRTDVAAINNIKQLSPQALLAGMIGNILEWYDFGLYGYLAPVIGSNFFPATSRIASLLGAYSVFAVGFAMRPLGAAVLGHIGDRIGRTTVLVTSVVLMGVATCAIGLLPTYRQIGLWAPALLVAVRIFQGFSVGGEFTGSVSYLVETSPRHRRGIAGSFANIGSTSGYLLAAAAATVTAVLAAHARWPIGPWRVPFLAGGLIAILAYWMRTRLRRSGYEPPPMTAAAARELPLQQAFTGAPRAMLLAVAFTWGYGVADYLTLVFLPTFASEFGHLASSRALAINTLGDALAVAVIPLAGWLTDRVLRRRTMLILAFALIGCAAVGLFALAGRGTLVAVASAQFGFAICLGVVMGSAPAMLAEQFPSQYRLSGYSVSFNLGLGFGGGTAPLIATALIGATQHKLAAAGYLTAAALLAIGALALMPDRSREPLL